MVLPCYFCTPAKNCYRVIPTPACGDLLRGMVENSIGAAALPSEVEHAEGSHVVSGVLEECTELAGEESKPCRRGLELLKKSLLRLLMDDESIPKLVGVRPKRGPGTGDGSGRGRTGGR